MSICGQYQPCREPDREVAESKPSTQVNAGSGGVIRKCQPFAELITGAGRQAWSIQRFVLWLGGAEPPFRRKECVLAEELQVDFGQQADVIDLIRLVWHEATLS